MTVTNANSTQVDIGTISRRRIRIQTRCGAGDDTYLAYLNEAPTGPNGETEVIADKTGANTLVFGPGIDPNAITVSQDATQQYLLIDYSPSDTLAIDGGQGGAIQTYTLADGSQLTTSQLIGRYATVAMSGTAEDGSILLSGGKNADTLTALSGNATISGGRGNDTLNGGGNGNTYGYDLGDGLDRLTDTGSGNTLQLGTGITTSNVTVGKSGNDLILDLQNGSDRITLKNQLVSGAFTAAHLADGTTWTAATLAASALAMGGEANDSLGGTAGNDTLTGGTGKDGISGGDGDDVALGGLNNDTLLGGAGNDRQYRMAA